MLIYSVPADQFIVSIHCGEECVYQSVLGGRGEREKVEPLYVAAAITQWNGMRAVISKALCKYTAAMSVRTHIS